MPNRILRDWTNSNRVNQISAHAERFFTRLMMKADDYGRFYADTRLLKSNLFPLMTDTIREADITRCLTELANTVDEEGNAAGMIVLYEVKGKKYLQIDGFGQRMDRAKEKFPPPPPANEAREITRESRAESESEAEASSESKFYIKIARERFDKKPSEWLMENKEEAVSEFLMKNFPDKKLPEILSKFDSEYPHYDFQDHNHVFNSFKSVCRTMNKPVSNFKTTVEVKRDIKVLS